MFIPDDQLEREVFPLAYQLTIYLVSNWTDGKESLEKYPAQQERRAIKEIVSQQIQRFGNNLQALRVARKKIEIIIDAPAETEKIINSVTLSIIEILRCSKKYSEKINLWEPQKKIESIWTSQSLLNAIQNVNHEKELALKMRA